jgi:HD-GYP domain-containing protein (c-di-GMP phosphodiesterase class II)
MAADLHTHDVAHAAEAPLLEELRRVVSDYYAHDGAARVHATNVARLALKLGVALKLERTQLVALALGAILHDVGKLSVPARILSKPGRLTDAEWQLVRRHPPEGAQLVAPLLRHPDVAAVVRWHHERVDGTGYPDGLRGEAIPLPARIVAVADAYEAMVATRPYAPAKTPREAFTEVVACAGKQFDPVCVARMHALLDVDIAIAA